MRRKFDFETIVRRHILVAHPGADEAHAVHQLREAIGTARTYQAGAASLNRGAPRRDKLAATAKAAARLISHLRGFDPYTNAELLRQGARTVLASGAADPSPHADAAEETLALLASGHKAQALSSHVLLLRLLAAVETGYHEAATATPALSAGRPPRPDPVVFAVETLVHLWRRCTGQEPNLSSLTGGFLAFAQDALCDPLGLGADAVRHAAEVLLPAMQPAKPGLEGAGAA